MKKINKAAIAGLLTVLIVGVLTFFYYSSSTSSNSKIYSEIEKHKITDLGKLKGNYFLLHFWAKWCEPCIEEIPELVEFAKKIELPKPLFVLAVSLDPSLEIAKQIFPDQGASLPPGFILALDAEHKFAESLGSFQYPETYLIGQDGQILEKWVGPQKWNKPEVLDFFQKRLQ